MAAGAMLLVVGTVGYVFGIFLPTYNNPATRIAGVEHGPSKRPASPPLARRVMVVVVDGLGRPDAEADAGFRALAERGTTRTIIPNFPTFTSPALVSMVTGLRPADHGMRLNGEPSVVPGVDHVLSSVRRARIPTHVRPRHLHDFDQLIQAGPDDDVGRGAMRFALELRLGRIGQGPLVPANDFWMVHIDEVDEAGHDTGAGSPRYVEETAHAALLVSRIADLLDFEKDVLVVLSDHGQRQSRGHGGPEPEVLEAYFLAIGPSIGAGRTLPPRNMEDVAATLTLLAGAKTPSSSFGWPMLDLIEEPDDARARRAAEPFEQVAKLRCALVEDDGACSGAEAIADRLEAGDVMALGDAERLLADVDPETPSPFATRGPWAALVLGIGLLAYAAARRRLADPGRHSPRGIGPALGMLVALLYVVPLWLKGYEPSFSAMAPEAIFLPDATLAVGLSALVGIPLGLFARRDIASAIGLLLGFAGGFGALCVLAGADPATVPPPHVGVLVLQLAPMNVGAGLVAVGWAIGWAVRTARGSAAVEGRRRPL